MSKQIQFRRGSATEHANFIGANGEITVDTTNKTLRVHDGETVGGTILAKQSELPDISNADYVVESQLPTAENNYTWYRKYKSGWIEQGGKYTTTTQDHTIVLPVEMSDANYTVLALPDNNPRVAGGFAMIDGGTQTTTGFTLVVNFNNTQPAYKTARWFVSGVAAE